VNRENNNDQAPFCKFDTQGFGGNACAIGYSGAFPTIFTGGVTYFVGVGIVGKSIRYT
jgi:hypothetical protein